METIKQSYRTERSQIHYIRWTVESYDGMAVVRTVDPKEAFIEILTSPGCVQWITSLLDSLKEEEYLEIEKITQERLIREKNLFEL